MKRKMSSLCHWLTIGYLIVTRTKTQALIHCMLLIAGILWDFCSVDLILHVLHNEVDLILHVLHNEVDFSYRLLSAEGSLARGWEGRLTMDIFLIYEWLVLGQSPYGSCMTSSGSDMKCWLTLLCKVICYLCTKLCYQIPDDIRLPI